MYKNVPHSSSPMPTSFDGSCMVRRLPDGTKELAIFQGQAQNCRGSSPSQKNRPTTGTCAAWRRRRRCGSRSSIPQPVGLMARCCITARRVGQHHSEPGDCGCGSNTKRRPADEIVMSIANTGAIRPLCFRQTIDSLCCQRQTAQVQP